MHIVCIVATRYAM